MGDWYSITYRPTDKVYTIGYNDADGNWVVQDIEDYRDAFMQLLKLMHKIEGGSK